MALIAAAVCPHPPLLIPSVGVGVEPPARAAALRAVERVLAPEPDLVVVVGDDVLARDYDPTDLGSLSGYGVDEVLPLGAAGGASPVRDAVLPLSLTVGAWLLRTAGWSGATRGRGVPAATTPTAAAGLGAELAGLDARVTMLCMGDGSARRTEKAPGWLDARAGSFDETVARALGEADAAALARLDPQLARDLLVAGRASWQVLAGAATGDWEGQLLADEAPYGVGYFVAVWAPASGDRLPGDRLPGSVAPGSVAPGSVVP